MATTVIRVAVANSCRQSSAEQYSPITRHHQNCCRQIENLSSATCVCCASCRANRKTHPSVGDPKPSCSLDSQATRLKSNLKKCLHKHFQNKRSSSVSDKEERKEIQRAIEGESLPISGIKMTDIKKNGFSRNGGVYPTASSNENPSSSHPKPRFGGKIMQNVGLPKSLDTNLNTACSEVELRRSEQPLLRKALSDNFGRLQQNDDDEEEVDRVADLAGTVEPPKIKTRSRFSSAFRSFRGSKSSKKKASLPLADIVLSSGGEDQDGPPTEPTELKKKKNKLSKKFSLNAIKRNKVNPKKEEVVPSNNLLLVESSTQTTQSLDRRSLFAAENDQKRKVTVTSTNTPPTTHPQTPESSPTKFDKVRKIQITIQGKKIEHTHNNNNGLQGRKNLPTTTTEITSGVTPTTTAPTVIDEGDYLTAAEEVRHQEKPITTTTPFKKSSKKKLKYKLKSNSPHTSPPGSSNKSITSTISTTTTTEEKFIVTQSICDTPPRERAPAKPSRATGPPPASTGNTQPTATGAIRKSLSHHIPKLRRQRLHVADSTDSELNFMLREGTIERGRRFPRPSSIDSQVLSPIIIAQSQSLPAPLGTPESLLPPQPPRPSTSEVEAKSLPPFIDETIKETQETQREPTSLPTITTTSTIVSTIEIEKSPTAIKTTNTTKPTTSSDPSTLFSGNNIQNPNLSGSINNQSPEDNDDISIEDPPTIREQQSLHFAVGTPVRPQRTSVPLAQVTFDSKDFSSIGSNKSSGSDQSPTSENSIHRRKIQYIDQPSIYTDEERDILEGKREVLSYLSGISEYSFDSEFSGDTPPMPAFGDLTMDQEDPPIMTSSAEKREHLYKILVIGELGTGKTSFIKRYVHQFFSQNYRATIGVDFALKVLHWDSNTVVRLQLWDIAGQERFGNMTRVYYKEAVGAFIVFDVTRSGTFDCVSKWKEDLDSKVQLPDGSPIPCILLANKCDQDKQGIITTPEKMDEYVRENGFAGWYETSAKENINIDEAARALVNKILLNDKLISAADIADSEKFNLANSNGGQTTTQAIKSKCSC